MKPPRCIYLSATSKPPQIAAAVQQLHDQVAAVLDGRIDGHNLSSDTFGGGILFSAPNPNPPNPVPPTPPVVSVPIGDETTVCYLKKKRAYVNQSLRDAPGLEMVVDASSTAYGRICVVDRADLTKQVGSLIPTRESNPQFKVRANYGRGSFGTSADFDWELHRNGSASLADDGSAIGTTREMFRIGTLGADSNYVAIKRTDNLLSVRLADDSNDAGVLAREAIIQVSDGEKVYVNTLNGLVLANDLGVKWSQSDGPDDTLDLDLTRSAAGKALVRDPSGGNTSPMLQLGGTDNTFPAVKRSSTRAQTKLADDSAFAGHDAGTLDLYGAATGFRTRLDPGTPVANKAITVPPVDGTMPVASSITANALLKFSGSTGESVPSGVADNGTTATVDRALVVKRGASSGTAAVGGQINSQIDSVGNVGSGEDTLHTYSVPASTLGTNGDSLEFEAAGIITNPAGDPVVRVRFGSTLLLEATCAPALLKHYVIRGTITRLGATSQIAHVTMIVSQTDGLTPGEVYTLFSEPAETLSNAITLKTTGEGVDSDEITERAFRVKWMPA